MQASVGVTLWKIGKIGGFNGGSDDSDPEAEQQRKKPA
jgi:hypothetical protein